MIGIDPSLTILEQARCKPSIRNVAHCQGAAEALPFRDGCADLVFMSMVYHHFTDPTAVATECHRVLRQGGYACIRSGTRESDFPHRHFFPALQALIDSDLKARRDIESVFAASGFTPVVHQVVTQVTAASWPSFIEKSALQADSFLARLSDEDFDRGLAALRNPGDAIDQNDAVTEEIDWFVLSDTDEESARLFRHLHRDPLARPRRKPVHIADQRHHAASPPPLFIAIRYAARRTSGTRCQIACGSPRGG